MQEYSDCFLLAEERDFLVLEDRNGIILERVALDVQKKHKKSYKITEVALSFGGDDVTVLYKFIGDAGLDIKPSLPIIELKPTRALADLISGVASGNGGVTSCNGAGGNSSGNGGNNSGDGDDRMLNTRKMALTYIDPDSGEHYLQTHCGKVYRNHFGLGLCEYKSIGDVTPVPVRECEHEFKNITKQTRSGDEEVTVYSVCVKCNAHEKNTITKQRNSENSIESMQREQIQVDKLQCLLVDLLRPKIGYNEEARRELAVIARLVAGVSALSED